MLFTTLRYAIFFAVAFAGSWSLALPARPNLLARILASGAAVALSAPLGDSTARFAGAFPAQEAGAHGLYLLVLSYYFYASWNWRYLPLIFGSSTVDYFLARAIAREETPRRRRLMLALTVALNLGFLGCVQYWNFALENARLLSELITGAAAAPASDALKVLLPPVGISFFTFESMSYVVDVYRGELKPHRSYLRYLLFVAFFPHLVAGPIVRPRDLLPQLERPPSLTRAMGGEALFLVALGLVKKLVISDQLAQNLVDRVFERPESYSALEVLAGVYGYAVQIYCDFSGYTDIAIGSALLLGVRFPRNFDAPYQATNLADFWRRWHISLSTWLRDYLYIPLGGNRGGPWGTYRNLMITMVLGGLWHGASWTFVFWGFLHGLGLGVTRAWERRGARPKRPEDAPAGGRTATLPRSRIRASIGAGRWPHLAGGGDVAHLPLRLPGVDLLPGAHLQAGGPHPQAARHADHLPPQPPALRRGLPGGGARLALRAAGRVRARPAGLLCAPRAGAGGAALRRRRPPARGGEHGGGALRVLPVLRRANSLGAG